MRFLVLVNPSSNGGRAGRQWKRFESLLPCAEFVLLKDIEEARAKAQMAVDYEAIVACGGDGTINAVADGVLSNPDKSLKFGVLYMGTSPDFCRFHGIPTAPEAASRVLLEGSVKEVPVLKANDHCFFCSCNVGMGAEIASVANRIRPYFGDGFGTFIALLRGISGGRRLRLKMDGEELTECNHLLFSRMPYIAGGMKLCIPNLYDNEFIMWKISNMSFWSWIGLLPKIYLGRPCGETRTCTGEVTVSSDEPVEVEYDGDPHGKLPLKIAVAERRLKLIVPKHAEVGNA